MSGARERPWGRQEREHTEELGCLLRRKWSERELERVQSEREGHAANLSCWGAALGLWGCLSPHLARLASRSALLYAPSMSVP